MSDIAIVGLAGRFPGAKNIEEFWKNLCDGRETTSFFTKDELAAAGVSQELLNDPNYVRASPTLEGIELFDAEFFGYSRREAEFMDPQQRILLECAWATMENAGYSSQLYSGSIGMFAGSGGVVTSYLLQCLEAHPEIRGKTGNFQHLGNDKDFLSTRVSYKLNLRGPSVAIQSACSTSLVAVHMACQSVLSGECDMAMAGGISVRIPQQTGYLRQEGDIYSKDGHCRAFDADASGIVFGSGAGLVMVKRLEDAIREGDQIYAVIKGSALNNDGASKMSYTASSSTGQVRCMTEALTLADVDPATIQYVEAHGTGTAMGDPVEISALTQTFRRWTENSSYCAIASVKTNLGHLDVAAGITSLIKVVLSLHNKKIPATINFKTPNPKIDFQKTPFFVNLKLTDWNKKDQPRRAAINGLGIGGTNAFFVLEEAPEQLERESSKDRDAHLLVLSGKTANALRDVAQNYDRYLSEHRHINVADMCFTTAIGRDHFNKRLALVGTSAADLQSKIQIWLKNKENTQANQSETENQNSDVIFAFAEFSAAKATQSLLNLYQTQDVFRQEIQKCDEILKSLVGGESSFLTSLLQADEKALGILESFAIQYSIAKMFESFGIVPSALSGDVNGLVFANSFAGALSLENAFRLVKAKLVSSPKLDQIVNSLKYETARYQILSNETGAVENNNPPIETKLTKFLSWSTVLTELGNFYSKGCEISWLNYESNMPKRKRLSLPTYPFQRKKYWIELQDAQPNLVNSEQTESQSQLNHPILKKVVELFDGKMVFTGMLGTSHSATLSSHVVFGKMIVPGAQYVDLAAYCIAQINNLESSSLNDIHFIAPLIVGKYENFEVQVVIDLKSTVQTVEIFSRKQGLALSSAWVKHCRGTIGPANDTSMNKNEFQSLMLKTNQMQKLTSPDLIYPAFRKIGLTYGNSFQGIKEAWVSSDKNEVITRIEVLNKENFSWKINPMVLDSAFQSCLLGQLDANTKFMTSMAVVPHSISEFQFKNSNNSNSYFCHIKTLDKNVWDIQLFTEQSEVVFSVKNYAGIDTTEAQLLGHTSEKIAPENIAGWIYKENWQLQQFLNDELAKSQTSGETQAWLLICGETPFSAPFVSALSHRKIEVIKVQLGHTEDVSKSIDLVTSRYPKKYFKKVVSLLSLDAMEITQNLSELEISNQFYLSYGRNLQVIQSLTQSEYFEKSDLILVNQNGASIEDVYTANLSQSGVLALAKTFRSEWPNRSCRFINLNTAIAAKEQIAKYLVSEILSESKEDINYSGGQRHVLRLKRQVLEELTSSAIPTEATCLITGGLGGLGFVIAQEFAEQGISSIVLVGRSEPPQEFQNHVEEFATKGTRLTYLRGDVSVQAQVSGIFSKIVELNLPAVKSIVHTAGKLQDAFLKNQTWESYVEVFKPKVLGAWNLHLESLKLASPVEQFILFSSISPLFGNHGQANYSAANAFLDQLAIVRKNIGQAATSVAWGPWSQVGMASSLTRNEAQNLNDSGFGFLAPESAKNALKQVLNDEFRHADVAIFDLDWNKFFAARENEASNTYFHELSGGLKIESSQIAAALPSTSLVEVPVIKSTAPTKPTIEKSKVREICEKTLRRVLALDADYEMDSKKSFSNMGMDSLLSVEYISQVKSEMAKIATGFSISPTVIYNYPNLHSFTEFLFNKLATAAAIAPTQAEPEKPVVAVAPSVAPTVRVDAPPPVAVANVAAPIAAAAAIPAPVKNEVQKPQPNAPPNDLDNSIAIVGMGCRFPGGSNSVDEYWDYLVKGMSAISEIPIDRWDINEHYSEDKEQPGKSYARTGGFLTGIDIKSFDAGFFEISEAAAKGMDPQLRMLMEVTWDALENAGQAPGGLFESKAGIYVGSMLADYIEIVRASQDADDLEMYNGSLASADTLAGRLAYYLGSFGPTVHTNTACSSSLVAIHLACQALRSGECNIAIAGGVNALLSPTGYSWISKLGVLSASGQSYSFDKRADGYVRAEGCGIIILKRYADAIANRDQIIGVVRGTSAGHGGRASSPTAPNGLAQEVLIADTLRAAGIEPSQVGYLEAHATATLLGDPIEINAASNVFATGRTPSDTLILGSAKGNFGHMEGAAGVAGLIRAVLSLKHKMVPPQANFNDLNPNIQLGESNITIPKMLTPFPVLKGKRVAGISSFGMSGIMAHAVLEEAPQNSIHSRNTNSENQLLVLSSRSEAGLRELAGKYVNFLKTNPQVNLADLCFTAATGRDHHEHRLTITGNSVETFLSHLNNWLSTSETERGVSYKKLSVSQLKNDTEIKTAFLFSGQGSQYVGMAKKLYAAQPAFQKALNQCAEILKKHLDQPLLNLIFEGEDESSLLHQTRYTQPALFAVEYSLSEMWKSFGITPTAVMGHSVGELVGACVAGVFSLEDGLMLICRRAELMQTVGGQGSMAAVMCPPAQVIEVLAQNGNKVSVAAINGPTSVTISGYVKDLDEVLLHFEKNKIMFKRLTVSHAFHSKQMDEMLSEFTQSARKVRFSPPQIALVSNVDGQLATTQVCEPEYWAQHLRKAVMFAEGIKTLAGMGIKNYLEMGPGATLVGMATPCLPENNDAQLFSSLRRGREDGVDLLECLGSLHTQGYKINWENYYSEMPELRRISLPTYAFQRKTYWVEKKIEATVKPILTLARKAETFLGERNLQLTNSTETVFESVISLETHDFLNHHLVFDAAIVPGATYLEMSSSAALQIYGQGIHQVEDLIIHQALIIKRNERTLLRTRVEKISESKAQWTIQSQVLSTTGQENKWTTHVTGQLTAFVTSQGVVQNLREVLQQCNREISAQDHYAVFTKQGIPYGTEFKVVRRVKVGTNQVIGEVELQEKLAKNCSQYLMHPAMLDGCLQVGNSIITEIIGSNGKPFALYLPFSFDSWQFFQYSGGPVWCQAIHRGARRLDQPIQMDLIVFDSKGNLVAKASGYSAVEANPGALLKDKSSNASLLQKDIYELVWKNSPPANAKVNFKGQETWIVFADQSSLCRSTISSAEAAGVKVVKVYATGPSEESSNIFSLDPHQTDDYQSLLSKISQKISGQFPLKRILHWWSSAPGSNSEKPGSITHLEVKQKFGFESVLGLVKALVNANMQLAGLYILTRDGQSEVDQLNFEALPQSLCWGLGRGLNVEHPELNAKLIDVGSETSSPPNLLKEILDSNLEQEIILKGSQRWVKRLERKNVQFKADTLNLTSDATYVVTGGLGGLGFALAQKLAERGAKNLVLLGRSEPKPEISDWIAKVKNAGTNVAVKKLDIADFAASKDVFSKLKIEMPPVKGFFHAAGVSDMQNIAQLSRESFQKVFQAKIQGAWNLHQLSQELSLDYFVMFSSAAAFMPAAGQAAYAAANTFVDSLIQARRHSNQVGHSFNWGIWAEVGMAAKNNDEAMWAKGGMSGIPVQEGMDLLTKLIQIPQRQLTIMSVKWEQFSKTLDEAAEQTFFSSLLQSSVAAPKETHVKVEAPTGPQSHLQMTLQESTEGERKAVIVQYLVEQMGKLIANSNGKIDTQEGLMAQGLDSLGSIELRNRLKKDLKIPFPPTLIFNYPSIEVLSDFILTQLPAFAEVETQVETQVEAPKQTQAKIEMPTGPQSQLQMKLQASAEGERKAVVVQYLVEQMGKLIANSNGRIDTQEGLMAQGLDSLGSIELRNRLKKDLKIPFPPTLIFNYPSIEVLSDFILTQLPAFTEVETQIEVTEPEKRDEPEIAAHPVNEIEVPTDSNAIAIIGVGCRYPGDVNSLESFWNVLSKGVDTLTDIPKSRFDIDQYYNADPSEKGKIYLKRGSFINFDQLQNFDAKFFGLSPAEAKLLDPAQRLLLETVWEAIENAGEIPKNLVGSKTGVFIGDMYHDYSELIAKSEKSASDEMYSIMGGGMSAVAGRISYTMGFEGPSVTLDTACSSSLVAIHLACDALRNGSADRAIAGGVNVILTPTGYVGMSRTKAFSFEGRCATFDESADGYVRGEGCGVILLKRLGDAIRDKNPILGVVRGSAVNQDGKSVTMTAPNGLAQERLIKSALSQANIKPHEVSYLEAHGTGTSLGDPIESQAFGNVLKEGRTSDNPLLVGSVKTNFGHTEAAAGVAGVIKVLLAMQHRELPPNLHFKKLNSKINLEVVPAKVVTEKTPWKTFGKLIAGVSSFGISGTNAHVIIEEPPRKKKPQATAQSANNENILCLSARDSQGLHDLADQYVSFLKQSGPSTELSDICYSAATTRSNFGFKLTVTGVTKEEVIDRLQAFRSNRKVNGVVFNEAENSTDSKKIGFLYPDQNSYFTGLGSQLYKSEPEFKKAINAFAEMARRYTPFSVIDMMEKKSSDKTGPMQIQLFAIQYALTEMWKSFGLQPTLVTGYGTGEFAAAYSAGVVTLEEGIRLICSFSEIEKGSAKYNEQTKQFEKIVSDVNFKKPAVPYYSGDSGQRIAANELTNKKYWNEFVNTRTSGGAELLKFPQEGTSNSLVIGSENGLRSKFSWASLVQNTEEKTQVLKVVCYLFTLGVSVDWEKLINGNTDRVQVGLPNYPFQRKHFWVDSISSIQPEQILMPVSTNQNKMESNFVTDLTAAPHDQRLQIVAMMLKNQITKILALDKSKPVDENKDFSDLGLDSLTLVNLNSELKGVFAEKLKITHNILFEKPTIRKLSEYICGEIFPVEQKSEKKELQTIKASSEAWIKIWDPKPHAVFRIFCFHYAGGSALMYKDWCQHLPDEVELCAVQLPGRWERTEEPMEALTALMGPLTDSISELMDKPFAFFGYSMGGAFAFEAVRELRRRGSVLPVHLFAAACSPPQLHTGSAAASFGPMSDEAFIRKFKNIFGTIYGEKEMLESSMKDTWIGVLRNDMNALSSYSYQAEKAFQISVTAMSGSTDSTLPISVLEQWRAQTTGEFNAQVFKGGHLFIHEVPTEELVEFVLNKISLLKRNKAV